jgi:hypothetical protein
MTEPNGATSGLYDLVLTGQFSTGLSAEQVIGPLAALFKMPSEKVVQLLASAPVVLKRNLDWEAAKKYRAAIKQTGALSDIRPVAAATAPEAPAPVSQPAVSQNPASQTAATQAAVAKQPVTAAPDQWQLRAAGEDLLAADEKSAMASRLDAFPDFSLRPAQGALLDEQERSKVAVVSLDLSGISLAPAGTAVLTEAERAAPVAAVVAEPSWDLAQPGERLAPAAAAAPAAPNTDHIGLA